MNSKEIKQKNKTIWKKIIYKFDEFLSKGMGVQFVMLIVAALVIIVIAGLLVGIFIDGISLKGGIWDSLMHLLDQGTITGDETNNKLYLTFMLVVTGFGLLLMGTIVGILNNAISSRLAILDEGLTQVMEKGHIVIIGYDDNCSCIVRQQMESNENWTGNRSIVVVDNIPSVDMKTDLQAKLNLGKKLRTKRGVKRSKLIYRTGNTVNEKTLQMVSLESAKSIIINKSDDFEVIRILLAISKYFKRKDINVHMTEKMPNIVTLMHNEENIQAAKVAIGIFDESGNEIQCPAANKIQIMYMDKILAHIFAQICRQPGLSWVLSEIFSYNNSELYIEDGCDGTSLVDMGFVGKSFRQISKELKTSIALGIQKADGRILLNPDYDETIFEQGDRLVHLALDDNEIKLRNSGTSEETYGKAVVAAQHEEEPYHIIILGWSHAIKDIVIDINDFAMPGSTIKIVSDYEGCEEANRGIFDKLENVSIEYIDKSPYHWEYVSNFLDMERELSSKENKKITNILILCQDDVEREEADRRTAVLLLNLRTYLNKYDMDNTINVTSEINQVEDQMLLQSAEINDFVVGDEIANRIMVQVANNTDLYQVFRDLLNDDGSEFYLRDIIDYVDINNDFTFEYVSDVALEKHEIALGWIHYEENSQDVEVRLNPKCEPICMSFKGNDYFTENDKLIVLAED